MFDEFSMPAIPLGAGRSEAKVFVDSNHSLVSLMTRIVPSPDWYIGVDSFEVRIGHQHTTKYKPQQTRHKTQKPTESTESTEKSRYLSCIKSTKFKRQC